MVFKKLEDLDLAANLRFDLAASQRFRLVERIYRSHTPGCSEISAFQRRVVINKELDVLRGLHNLPTGADWERRISEPAVLQQSFLQGGMASAPSQI